MSPFKHELAERDSALEGLALVLDANALARAIELQFGMTAQPERRLELEYVRYKPGRRCIAMYRDPTASEFQPFVATALTPDGFRKHSQASRSSTTKVTPFPSQFADPMLIEDCHVIVTRFPVDRGLRHVRGLFDPDKRIRVLRRVLGRNVPSDVDVHTLTYKPDRRFVARCQSTHSSPILLKMYDRAQFPKALSRVHVIRDARYPAANFLGANERYGAIAWEWLPGKNLFELRAQEPQIEHAFYKVGQHLSDFHRLSVPTGTRIPSSGTRATYTELAETIAILAPHLKRIAESIADWLNGAIDSCPADTLIHGDFYSKQVIVHEGGVRFIDFDQVELGERYHDLGNFVAHLHWSRIRGEISGAQADRFSDAFLRGYRDEFPEWDFGRFQVHLVAGLMRCTPHTFRRGLRDWPTRMQSLLTTAFERLRAGTDRDA